MKPLRIWPLFALEGTVTLRLRLAASDRSVSPTDLAVVELDRDRVANLPSQGALSPGSVDRLDEIAPLGWRCFAVLEDGRLVHHSFVARRADGPELFRVATLPSHRKRGLFRRVVHAIAGQLRSEGELGLQSKSAVRNKVSLRAHRRVGFEVIHRRYELVLAGLNVMRVASRVRRRLARRG